MRILANDDQRSIGALDVDECLVLLRWEVIGRLAVALPGRAPSVVPVNFVVDNGTILFLTGEGEKFDHLLDNPVSLQVDRFDWYRHTGWSVLVQGIASECSADELADVELEPWAPVQLVHVIRLTPTSITGRRIDLVAPAFDQRGYA